MGFLDSLSKTFSTGVDRAKFETDKFQRTSRINGDISNIKNQIDTNMRQLGERAFELYQQGQLSAPEIASLAQVVTQLRAQQQEKENELNEAQAYSFEQFQAENPRPEQEASTSSQNVPITNEQNPTYGQPFQSPPSYDQQSGQYSTPPQGQPYTPPTYQQQQNHSMPTYQPGQNYRPPQSGSSYSGTLPPDPSQSSTYSGTLPPTPTYGSDTPSSADLNVPTPTSNARPYDVRESTDLSGSGQINDSSTGNTGNPQNTTGG